MSNFNKKLTDDYQWDTYTQIYAQQAQDMVVQDKTPFLIKDSYVENGKIVFKENINGIWKELYQAIININPSEIFECGCGPGQHLHNIKKLNPKINTYGCELLQTQLDFGRNQLGVSPEIYDTVLQVNLSIPNMSCAFNEKYEFVYTQAVVMHLNHEKAKTFILNMANLSSKYVCLFENPDNHNFDMLLNEIEILNFYKKKIIYQDDIQHRVGILLEK